jgi:electron transfer flavoprotein alpha subunit
LSSIAAASAFGGKVTVLVAGEAPETVAQAASAINGVSQVLVAKDKAYEHGLPEAFAPLLAETQKKFGFSHVVAPHSCFGKNIMPRLAAILDVAQISDVTSIVDNSTFVRPIYAGKS